jgi:hypothetical protein
MENENEKEKEKEMTSAKEETPWHKKDCQGNTVNKPSS